MTWALVFSMALLAAMSWGIGPQCGHGMRTAAFVAAATFALSDITTSAGYEPDALPLGARRPSSMRIGILVSNQ
jgi:hypothetical protein